MILTEVPDIKEVKRKTFEIQKELYSELRRRVLDTIKERSCEKTEKTFTCEDCKKETEKAFSVSMEGEHLKTVCGECKGKPKDSFHLLGIYITPIKSGDDE